jgi:hypothetical protein
MIRSTPQRRLGDATTTDPGCPWYNPFCWFVPADDPTQCYGGGPNIDVAACVAANNAVAAASAQANPAAAQDYSDAATGNVIGLANPFTGTGQLSSLSTGIPVWVWLAGGGVLALSLLRK